MKKIALLGLSLIVALGAAAQSPEAKELLKSEEKAVKDAKEASTLVEVISTVVTPLTSNPAVSGNPQTYAIPAERAFKIYDDLFLNAQIGGQPNYQDMSTVLIAGYDWASKALPLDATFANAKGKVEQKYGKKLRGTVGGHASDFDRTASGVYELGNYKDAQRLWGIYADILSDPTYGVKVPSDSTIGYTRYLEGVSAYQAGNLEEMLNAFDAAIAANYINEDVLRFGAQAALQLQKSDKAAEYAKLGITRYPNNSNFILITVDGYIKANDYQSAHKVIDEAIADNPQNPALYYARGILYDNEGKADEAIASFKKAIEIKPDYAQGWLQLGHAIAVKYDKIDAAAPTDGAAYAKVKEEQLVPLLHESAAAFEKAYELDKENCFDALRYLRQIYHNLGDSANESRVNGLLQQ